MKPKSTSTVAVRLTFVVGSFFLFLIFFILFCSFRTTKMTDDFLKQLGISKTAADEKINRSFLNGSLDLYGVKNAKNIALGNRKAVALDIIAYAKKQAVSATFSKAYMEIREQYKPKQDIAQTPAEMKAENIARAKEMVADMEKALKTADVNYKPVFEKSLLDAKRNLKEAEDPSNKMYIRYAQNYDGLVKTFKESYDYQVLQWEKRFPANQLLYIKGRLQEFMEATKDIDFNAELVTKNGKKYFVNPAYERKESRWKMAFRAGKDVIEPAREAVQQWIEEIK